MNEFKTVYEEAQSEIIIEKSRFISHIKPIQNEQEALDFINQIKTKYWNATHNVYGYTIQENAIERYSDDGEPKGTAGVPTLQTIKDMNISNVVVVTTRYFGGIKLGAGGLVRAYRKSAAHGLNSAIIVTQRESLSVELILNYSYLARLQSLAPTLGFIINEIIYEENVRLEIVLLDCEFEKIRDSLMNILSDELNIKEVKTVVVMLDNCGQLLGISR